MLLRPLLCRVFTKKNLILRYKCQHKYVGLGAAAVLKKDSIGQKTTTMDGPLYEDVSILI